MNPPECSIGKIYLVGSGPGDPGLITMRAIECLRRAEVVLYDYLVNPQILAHAAKAELICLGRHGRGRIMSQEEINSRLIELARSGRTVVRLKGGDPAIFAHAADEIHELQAAGIPYEIVPGITAALAAGSYAEIPITHGQLASAVALVTGQQRLGKEQSALDFDALAKFPGTLVFYMGVTTAREWTAALIAAGKTAATPAAIVRRCSWPDQEVYTCTLGSVADELDKRRARPPVIVIVGEVVTIVPTVSWFSSRPLFGVRILVTRPLAQSDPLRDELSELGADVLVQPAIEIGPPPQWNALDSAISRLSQFDWLVFSSANGVRYLLDRLWNTQGDMRAISAIKLAAIGPGTADELARYHLRADLMPPDFRAESFAKTLSEHARGKRLLLVRASRGREVLATQLLASGAHVEQVVAYSSHDVERANPDVADLLSTGKIDWITVTSSAIARSLFRLFGEELSRAKLASISPVTSQTLRDVGFEPAVEASPHTMVGLVQAICAFTAA